MGITIPEFVQGDQLEWVHEAAKVLEPSFEEAVKSLEAIGCTLKEDLNMDGHQGGYAFFETRDGQLFYVHLMVTEEEFDAVLDVTGM